MTVYETLLRLAAEPYENQHRLEDKLKSSDDVLQELKKECSVDTRQACESMVYKNKIMVSI